MRKQKIRMISRPVVLLLVLALVMAACGDDDDAVTTTAAAAAVTTTTAAAAAVTTTAAAAAVTTTAEPMVETVTVEIPAALAGLPAVRYTVVVPPEGSILGTPSPLHADPGQAALDIAAAKLAEVLGADTNFADANLDVDRHIQIADSMLAQGVTVIVTDELAPNSMDPLRERAAGEGVPVVLIFSTVPGAVQEDDAQAGREMAATLNAAFPDGAPGAILANCGACPVIIEREAQFRAGLEEYPGLEIIDHQRNTAEIVAEARTIAENMLQAKPEIKWFMTTNDNEAIGAGLAVRSLGRDDIVILGMNGTNEAVEAIKDGLITATWDSNQPLMGATAAVQAFNWLASGEAPEVAWTPFVKLDATNADQWISWDDRIAAIAVVDPG
jgi:ribose transport system substrate-binding protein